MLESPNARDILRSLATNKAVTLFRNNVGKAWQGDTARHGADVLVKNARLISFGLFKGSSDYIGWTSVRITQSMVGSLVAVFTALETKRTKGGKKSEEQEHFIKAVKEAGGLAGFAQTPADAARIVNGED